MAKLAAAFDLAAEALREMEPPTQDDATITVEDAAASLSVSTALVYQQIRKGALKAIHIGRAVRIPSSELEAFKKRRTK